MGIIVAIGGGELSLNETFAIDKFIVDLLGKNEPTALFIPTASGEPQGYIDTFNKVYGMELGCKTDCLKFLTDELSDSEIQDKIYSSDIIYVGGGNTKKMMSAWKDRRIDKYLLTAYERGSILSGLSAGSICWFKYGHSDSIKETTGEYCLLEGLDIIPFIHCPHYEEREEFDEFMKTQDIKAIAIENNCAIVFKDGLYKVINSLDSANAYILENINGKINKQVISNKEYLPINTI